MQGTTGRRGRLVPSRQRRVGVGDPYHTPFLELAIAGGAGFLLTGDLDLLTLPDVFPCPIVNADQFLEKLSRS